MNEIIQSQINNMISVIDTFQKTCEMAAYQDDGTMSKKEEKLLKKLKSQNEQYKKVLTKIKENY